MIDLNEQDWHWEDDEIVPNTDLEPLTLAGLIGEFAVIAVLVCVASVVCYFGLSLLSGY